MGGVGSGRIKIFSEEEAKKRNVKNIIKWRVENRRYYLQQLKKRYRKNRVHFLELQKKYRLNRKEEEKKRASQWYEKNKELVSLKNKELYQKKKEKNLKKYFKDLKYERENPGRGKVYYYANKERILARRKEQADAKTRIKDNGNIPR